MRRLPRWTSAVVAVVMATGLTSCGGDDDDRAGTTTTTSTTSSTATSTPADRTTTTGAETTTTDRGAGIALDASCTHEERGVTVVIRYPQDWHTNEGDATVPCSAFDPEPVRLERATEFPPDLGAVVRVEPVAFDRASRPSTDRIEGERREEVDGRQAVRLEVVSTGEGLRPAGERSVRWVIEAGPDRSIIAHTSDVEGNDFEASTQVLDAMVRSFSIR